MAKEMAVITFDHISNILCFSAKLHIALKYEWRQKIQYMYIIPDVNGL